MKCTAQGFVDKLNASPATEVQRIFRDTAGFELTEEEMQTLYNCKDYKSSPIPEDKRSEKESLASLYSNSLYGFVAKLLTS